jgi:outer membrane biosynthesis protein TonB
MMASDFEEEDMTAPAKQSAGVEQVAEEEEFPADEEVIQQVPVTKKARGRPRKYDLEDVENDMKAEQKPSIQAPNEAQKAVPQQNQAQQQQEAQEASPEVTILQILQEFDARLTKIESYLFRKVQ